MRFHIGLSFRLKTLKKFLFPILIGLFTYFGSAFLGFSNVYAYENLSNYYNFVVPEVDFSQYTLGEYNLKDILDLTQTENSNFYIYAKVEFDGYVGNDPKVNFILLDKYFSLPTNFGNKIFGNTSRQYVRFSNNANLSNVYIFFLNDDLQDEQNTQVYNDLKSCLIDNNCSSSYMSNAGTIGTTDYFYSTNFGVTEDLDINVFTSPDNTERVVGYYYYSDLPIKNIKQSNLNSYYIRTVKVNGTTVDFNTNMPTYCDFYDCSINESQPENNTFQVVDNQFRSLYLNIDKNDFSNLNLSYSYSVYDIDIYDNNLDLIPFWYYGRKNNGSYYSYDSLNCTNSSSASSVNNTYTFTFNNFSCTNDLTNFDKIYVYTTQTYLDSSLNTFIYGLNITSNSDVYYGNYLGVLYEHFTNLSSGFKLLLSTYNDYNPRQVNVITDNDYVGFDLIDNSNSTLTLETRGDWYINCKKNEVCNKSFGNKIYNKNLLIYDDLSYSNVNSTNLKLFIEDNIIVSIVNNNSVSYYDNNGNIVSNNISLTYDSTDNSNLYDISDVFSKVNDYIDSLEEDMFTFHNLIDSCYEVLPEVIQNLISIIYMLSLTYLVFKVIRK